MAEAITEKPDTGINVVQIARAVGDDLRANILRVLCQDSFGVLELCAIFDMAQPALSHHLKILSNASLVIKRREGTNVFYGRQRAHEEAFLGALFAALDADPVAPRIAKQIDKIHAERVARSERFFATHAQALEAQSELVCPITVYAPAVIEAVQAMAPGRHSALEIGPGTGELMVSLSELFDEVIGIDVSERMLTKTAATVDKLSNVKLVRKDFLALPRIRKYDAMVAAMVVHHMPSPQRFFAQAARVLKPGAVLVVAELCAHTQEWVKDLCGDLWLGFEAVSLNGWANDAGFVPAQPQYLAQRNGFRVQNQLLHFE